MASALTKYSLINAKLRARISMILSEEKLTELANAPSLDAAFAVLRETPYADLEEKYSLTGDLKQVELSLLEHEIDLYKNIKKHLHPNSVPVVEALLSRFEIDNLKNAIRLYFDRTIRGRSIESSRHYVLYEPIIHEIPIDLILQAESFDAIAGLCANTPYGEIIRKYRQKVELEGSLFRMEIGFDHYYFSSLLRAVGQLSRQDRSLALRLIGVVIDLENISRILRFQKLYNLPLEAMLPTMIPGGGHLTRPLIEELHRGQSAAPILQEIGKENYPRLSLLFSVQTSDSTSGLLLISRILEEIKKLEVQRILTGNPFTIGILLAYFMLKNEELGKIRKLLNAKQYGMNPQWIENKV